jgi:hypothetical protein
MAPWSRNLNPDGPVLPATRSVRWTIALLVFVALQISASTDDTRERRAIRAGKHASVKVLDPMLPNVQFFTWFRSLVGSKARIVWEVNDCGEQTGSPGDDPDVIPMCAEATAELPGEKKVVVSIAVGTLRKGVFGKPALFWAIVEQGGVMRDARKLSDLEKLLRR